MADPDLPSNPAEFQRVAKAASDLQVQVEGFQEYRQLEAELEETRSMLKDGDGAWLGAACCAALRPQMLTRQEDATLDTGTAAGCCAMYCLTLRLCSWLAVCGQYRDRDCPREIAPVWRATHTSSLP